MNSAAPPVVLFSIKRDTAQFSYLPSAGRSNTTRSDGEVPERSNGAVSKTVVGVTPPRVRIPVSPPIYQVTL
jgi:hypothetical protein